MLSKIKNTLVNIVRKPGNLRQRLCEHSFNEPTFHSHEEWKEVEALHPLTREPIGKVLRRNYKAKHKCAKCGFVRTSDGYDTKPIEIPTRFRNERLK